MKGEKIVGVLQNHLTKKARTLVKKFKKSHIAIQPPSRNNILKKISNANAIL